jgi:HlyD family secretion protein
MFRKHKKMWIVVIVVLLVAAGGGYWYTQRSQPAATQKAQASTINTATARRGELILETTGSGQVIANQESNLSFSSGGTLLTVNVVPGQTVTKGEELATIDDTEAQLALAEAQAELLKAQADLAEAQITEADRLAAEAAVAQAKQNLADVQNSPTEAELAAAEAAVIQAQADYDELLAKPDANDVASAQLDLDQAKNSLWSAQMSRDAKGTEQDKASGSYDSAQVSVLNAEISVTKAEMALAEAKQPATEEELAAAKATLLTAQQTLSDLQNQPTSADLANAQAELASAQATLDDITAADAGDESSVTLSNIRQAEAALQKAQAAYETAQENLEDTVMVAPYDGTIMAVNYLVGEYIAASSSDSSSGTAVIEIADLRRPLLEVYIDQEDLNNIGIDYEAQVNFDSMPDDIYIGHVTQIDPGLVDQGGVQVISVLVELDADSYNKPQGLPTGLNATVDIIGGEASNVVLIPVEALRDLGDGTYAVFVVKNGEMTMRTVEVGLMDMTYAEITSGLEAGEMVSTGLVETQ